MNAEQFAYWLQGFSELNAGEPPSPEQWKSICEHLGTVFNKVTPAYQPKPFDFPGVRTLELRPSDVWPGGIMPTITC